MIDKSSHPSDHNQCSGGKNEQHVWTVKKHIQNHKEWKRFHFLSILTLTLCNTYEPYNQNHNLGNRENVCRQYLSGVMLSNIEWRLVMMSVHFIPQFGALTDNSNNIIYCHILQSIPHCSAVLFDILGQIPAVWMLDLPIQRINLYRLHKYYRNPVSYPVDSDYPMNSVIHPWNN